VALTIIASLLFLAVAETRRADAIENSWTTKAPMHASRCSAGVAAVEGIIYAIGGSRMQNISNHYFSATINSTEAYNPATNTWTEKSSIPTARSSFGAGVYQNKIYCIGGFNLNDDGTRTTPTGVNEVYDPATDTWETKTPMPTARYGLQANVVDEKIYLIGGWYQLENKYKDVDESAQVDVYDPKTDTWTLGTPTPTAVADYASAVVKYKIYVISGVTCGTTITDLTQIYDPKTEEWSSGASIPMGVKNAAAGAIASADSLTAIFVVGGSNATYSLNGQYANQVYFPETNTWNKALPMPIDKAGLSVTIVNNTLYAIGGGHNIFTPDSTTTMQYTPFTTATIEPFPTILLVTVIVVVVVVISVGVLIFFKKNKQQTSQ